MEDRALAAGDVNVSADYEGSGRPDLATFDPATDVWTIHLSDGKIQVVQVGDPAWGDVPAPGNYEGLGRADLAVYRPAFAWWIIRLSTGKVQLAQFGDPAWGDRPVPDNYGDGKTDLAVSRPSTGQWIVHSGGSTNVITPAPFDGFWSPPDWLSFHTEFVARGKSAPVIFLGDSVTYLWTNDGSTAETAAARAKFPSDFGVQPWRQDFEPLGAVNAGIPADQTQNLLWRVMNGEVDGKPMVAIVMIGIDDLTYGRTPTFTAAATIAVLKTIQARSPGTRIIVVGVLPPARNPGGPLLTEVSSTNAMVAQWVAAHGVTFDSAASVVGEVDINGHPTPRGYSDLAAGLVRCVVGVRTHHGPADPWLLPPACPGGRCRARVIAPRESVARAQPGAACRSVRAGGDVSWFLGGQPVPPGVLFEDLTDEAPAVGSVEAPAVKAVDGGAVPGGVY
jgi:hypothetical protein